MITNAESVLSSIKSTVLMYDKRGEEINPKTLAFIIKQCEFDYDMDSEYNKNCYNLTDEFMNDIEKEFKKYD